MAAEGVLDGNSCSSKQDSISSSGIIINILQISECSVADYTRCIISRTLPRVNKSIYISIFFNFIFIYKICYFCSKQIMWCNNNYRSFPSVE